MRLVGDVVLDAFASSSSSSCLFMMIFTMRRTAGGVDLCSRSAHISHRHLLFAMSTASNKEVDGDMETAPTSPVDLMVVSAVSMRVTSSVGHNPSSFVLQRAATPTPSNRLKKNSALVGLALSARTCFNLRSVQSSPSAKCAFSASVSRIAVS